MSRNSNSAEPDYGHHIFSLKDEEWLEHQRTAGKVLAGAINTALSQILPGKSTKEIDAIIENYILDYADCFPVFKGYRGFPAASCISINEEVVHGIPCLDKIIQEGDVIKVDSGVVHKGAIADMAQTIIVGKPKDIKHKLLLECCSRALNAAIDSFKFNNGYSNRLGNIGNAIQKEAKKINANVIIALGGHGLEINCPHGCPFVPNIGKKDDGPILYPGTTIAIEPMMGFGSNQISTNKDGWTICTPTTYVHFEHTIFVHSDRVEIITF